PQLRVAVEPSERLEQDGEAFTRFVPADEEDGRGRRRTSLREFVARDIHPVGEDLARAAERRLDVALCFSGPRRPYGQAFQERPQRRAQRLIPRVAARMGRVE